MRTVDVNAKVVTGEYSKSVKAYRVVEEANELRLVQLYYNLLRFPCIPT